MRNQRIWVLLSLAFVGCTRSQTTTTSSLLRWKHHAGQSTVYRYQVNVRQSFGKGKKDKTYAEKGVVRVDGVDAKRAWLSFDPGRSLRVPEAQFELFAERTALLFPLPRPTPNKANHTWVIKGLGSASSASTPDYHITEEVKVLQSNGRTARLAWTRKILATAATTQKDVTSKQTIHETGTGTFDLEAGRYTKVSYRRRIDYKFRMNHKSDQGTVKTTVKMHLDRALSRKRTTLRRELTSAAAEAGKTVADYLRHHPAEVDVRQRVDTFVKQNDRLAMPTPGLLFHLHANPDKVWLDGLSSHRSPKEKERFLQAMSLPSVRGPLSNVAARLLEKSVSADPAVQLFVAGTPDPRFRERLATLVRSEDRLVSQRAAASLEIIGQLKNGPEALTAHAADPSKFMKLGHHLLLSSTVDLAQLKQLTGVLIQLMGNKKTAQWIRQVCVQWLEGITRHTLGADADAWRSFWLKNKARSFGAWMVDAARDGSPLMRLNAFLGMGHEKPFREGRKLLLDGLKSSIPRVRLNAASALARWKDRRALPVLLDYLEHPLPPFRQTAFVSLSHLHDTTLGYDPTGTERKRAIAAGRWRGWAAAKIQ